MLGPLRIVAFSHEVPLVMQEGIMPFPLSQLEHFWTPLIMTTTNLGVVSLSPCTCLPLSLPFTFHLPSDCGTENRKTRQANFTMSTVQISLDKV